MTVLGLAGCLVLALCLIPRPVQWGRLTAPLTVVGILAAFALGSWALAFAFTAIGHGAGRVAGLGIPPAVILFAPLVLIGVVGYVARLRRERPARAPATDDPEAYRDDDGWYSNHWRSNPANADLDLGTAGYRLELVDGPLAGRTARLRDSRFRLWVASPAQGGELVVRGAIDRPDLQGVTLLGAYAFSHGDEAMVWTEASSARGPTVEP